MLVPQLAQVKNYMARSCQRQADAGGLDIANKESAVRIGLEFLNGSLPLFQRRLAGNAHHAFRRKLPAPRTANSTAGDFGDHARAQIRDILCNVATMQRW
jgi:hypothetical protein